MGGGNERKGEKQEEKADLRHKWKRWIQLILTLCNSLKFLRHFHINVLDLKSVLSQPLPLSIYISSPEKGTQPNCGSGFSSVFLLYSSSLITNPDTISLANEEKRGRNLLSCRLPLRLSPRLSPICLIPLRALTFSSATSDLLKIKILINITINGSIFSLESCIHLFPEFLFFMSLHTTKAAHQFSSPSLGLPHARFWTIPESNCRHSSSYFCLIHRQIQCKEKKQENIRSRLMYSHSGPTQIVTVTGKVTFFSSLFSLHDLLLSGWPCSSQKQPPECWKAEITSVLFSSIASLFSTKRRVSKDLQIDG